MQIIVLGMHRSGTSVLARVLNMMGAYFAPEDKIMYPAPDNPKGFWERTDVLQINDRILQAGGGAWDNVLDFAIEHISCEQQRTLQRDIQRLIAALDANRPWMIKDPRLCITFPVWKAHLELPICVHIQRNPLQVANSLQKRNQIPITVGLAMWEAYTIAALNNSRGLPNIVIEEHNLLHHPSATVQQLKLYLETNGIECLRLPSTRELTAFIDRDLVHHSDSEDKLSSILNGQQWALWQAIREADNLDTELPHTLSQGATDNYRTYLSRREALQQIAARDEGIALLQQEVTSKVKALQQERETLTTRNREITQLREMLAARTNEINGFHNLLATKDQVIERCNEQQQVMAAQQANCERKSEQIIERLTARQTLIDELGRNIEATFMSWRWKVGHFAVRIVERLLGRNNVWLAKHRIEQILRELAPDPEFNKLHTEITAVTGITERSLSQEDRKIVYTRIRTQELDLFLNSNQELKFYADEHTCISVILVLHNRAELTFACLKALQEITTPAIEIVIVDNASTDRTGILLDRLKGNVKIIRNKDNLNFLLACNQAALHCVGDYILFLNNDTIPFPNALTNALQVFQEEPTAGAVGGKLILLDGSLQEAGSIVWQDGTCYGYGRGANPTASEFMFRRSVDYCSGAFLLVRRTAHTALGGFDEIFAPAYYEETDFCLRLRQQNFTVVYEPTAQILHYEFASATTQDHAIALQRSNRLRFVAKHSKYLATRKPPDLSQLLVARFVEQRPRILYIDDRVPHIKYGSGFPRSNFMLKTLAEQYLVTCLPLNFPDEEPWATIYTDIPKRIEVLKGCGRAGLASLLQQRKGYFDAVLVSRPHNMEFYTATHRQVYGSNGGVPIVYDAEAIFALRDIGKAKVLGGLSIDQDQAIREEIALAASATRVIAVSKREQQLFLAEGIKAVDVVGHAITLRPSSTLFKDRHGILFIGNLDADYSPNVDSILWFLERVFGTLCEAIPELELILVGSNKSQQIRDIRHPAVRIVGSVADTSQYYESCKILIAPTRFAAGIPYKVHEAAACGLPVVCSNILLNQLGWGEDAILAADCANPAAFVQQCLRLYRDETCWQTIRDGALARVQTECAESKIKATFLKILDLTLTNQVVPQSIEPN